MKCTCLWLILVISSCSAVAQTDEITCLKSFNSSINNTLLSLSEDSADISSERVNLIFELYISECGKIDSVQLKKSNLYTIGLKEKDVLSAIRGKAFPCLRNVYYNNELLPNKIIVVYNTKFLMED